MFSKKYRKISVQLRILSFFVTRVQKYFIMISYSNCISEGPTQKLVQEMNYRLGFSSRAAVKKSQQAVCISELVNSEFRSFFWQSSCFFTHCWDILKSGNSAYSLTFYKVGQKCAYFKICWTYFQPMQIPDFLSKSKDFS